MFEGKCDVFEKSEEFRRILQNSQISSKSDKSLFPGLAKPVICHEFLASSWIHVPPILATDLALAQV